MQTSDVPVPDPNLRQLYDSIQGQTQILSKQRDELYQSRENLTVKIEELEKMIEALAAALTSAAQYFPQPEASKPSYPSEGHQYGGVGN